MNSQHRPVNSKHAFMCSEIDDICYCDTVYIARSHLTELHMHFMAVIMTFLLKITTYYQRFQ